MLRVLGKKVYAQYKRFAALNFADDNNVLWCPFKKCGQGMVPPKKDQNLQLEDVICSACQNSFC
eukprot:TRINITY_DN14487_c0_g1_i1.p1 TRINITY_DN14487_c0_g1~~TRINITY_DN14487_c0_g1_i1.p1  ORF type:complete len:75 (+),score=15.59 TRINITY_DN14487_c0_g1_i1:36-227(+)